MNTKSKCIVLLSFVLLTVFLLNGCTVGSNNIRTASDAGSESTKPDENLQVILDNHFTADEAEQITAVYRCVSAKESNKGAYDIDSMCRQLNAKNRERLALFGSTGYQLETDGGVIVNLYGDPAYTVMMTVDEKTVTWDVSNNTFFYDTAVANDNSIFIRTATDFHSDFSNEEILEAAVKYLGATTEEIHRNYESVYINHQGENHIVVALFPPDGTAGGRTVITMKASNLEVMDCEMDE